mmetsp:Transcript_67386/g.106647  ORF Transcript_67386/g.106647 Transcript_67386/m.106647 type:complete len:114 (-) Transcript_67386:203-544(-)|eukprot:CAMPEP_0169163082 /NCGR_PEP_ID=MMETSP1015-20121227/58060_1 /TAXON_ID=342587 /ORGANISM="Karlodinium micrum, Strain CCMP2283" /LENGTH=113 /DNA_ID=CAMNT_0009235325 /DNA_START=75 /DNA_END=416 /DNA_ORIENTATION=+
MAETASDEEATKNVRLPDEAVKSEDGEEPKLKRKHSIIKGESGRVSRVDRHGVEIGGGSKEVGVKPESPKKDHQITFKDQVTGEANAEVKEVAKIKVQIQGDDAGKAGCCVIA